MNNVLLNKHIKYQPYKKDVTDGSIKLRDDTNFFHSKKTQNTDSSNISVFYKEVDFQCKWLYTNCRIRNGAVREI